MLKWKQLLAAGLGGVVCGKAASLARDNPETTGFLLQCSALSCGVGTAAGLTIAVFRKAPLHVYAISLGGNFALTSFVFFGLRHAMVQHLPRSLDNRAALVSHQPAADQEASRLSHSQEYVCSVSSGAMAGTLTSLVSRHSAVMVAGTGVGGMVAGFIGQWCYFRLDHWRKKQALFLLYPDLAPPKKTWSLNAFQSWFLGFWHRRSKASELDSELVLLESELAQEKAQLAALERELQDHHSSTGAQLEEPPGDRDKMSGTLHMNSPADHLYKKVSTSA